MFPMVSYRLEKFPIAPLATERSFDSAIPNPLATGSTYNPVPTQGFDLIRHLLDE